MSPASPPLESRKLAFLGGLFILLFFTFFTYTALFSYFTFDDGTTIMVLLKPFDVSFWRNLLNIVTVFTSAFRPLTTMFWGPLYKAFGFNPFPYRVVVQILMTLNIGVAYLLARKLELTREAATLTTLVFCYNASQSIMLYDTCMVDMVLCFMFYAIAIMVYVGGRQTGEPLGLRRIVLLAITWGLALDSKEVAPSLPGILVLYELIFRYRDFRDKRKALRIAGLLAAMLALAIVFLKVKVTSMSANPDYKPHITIGYMLTNMGQYIETLLYLPEKSVPPLKGCLIVLGFIAAGVLVRSWRAVFGVLFFLCAMIPVAVIPNRGGYAVYIGFFGLAMCVGAVLAGARSHLTRLAKRPDLETKTAVALFVCTAFLLGWAHIERRAQANGYYEWDKPKLVTLMNYFKNTIPEFPPNARVLITDNVWNPDWGMMFLLQLMYHDKDLWVDRPNNLPGKPDLASYDLVISYKTPDIDLQPKKFLTFPMKWEPRGNVVNTGEFDYYSPAAHGVPTRIDFAPQVVRSSQHATATIPGFSNVPISVIYRIVSGTKSTRSMVLNWCMLDANGTCTITAPYVDTQAAMIVDWFQVPGQRWVFAGGVLMIVK